MKPRLDIEALPLDVPSAELLARVAQANHSRLPIYEGTIDQVVGFIHVRDVLARVATGQPLDVPAMLRPALYVPETMPVPDLLVRFKASRAPLAVVLDEFGATAGLVTIQDIVEELVGDIPDEYEEPDQSIVRREDGSWLIDGSCNLDDVAGAVDIDDWPNRERLGYTTLAGFLLSELGHIPQPGEASDWRGYRFEVVDMDGRRIDKVLVRRRGADSDRAS
jgi:putative hemolysin